MIVTGFEYTGNAADVHGPLLHPNGRLYWCHGRKGHKVTARTARSSMKASPAASGPASPMAATSRWHSLGCGDNPVEVDFTPEGDIIGVQNLYYSQPRGDTLVHWLYGGVYERADQMKAIEGLPRTLEHMPVMYNFGHVAVSGCCFWRSFPTVNAEPRTAATSWSRTSTPSASCAWNSRPTARPTRPRKTSSSGCPTARRPLHRRAGGCRRLAARPRHRRLVPHRMSRAA